MFFNSCLRIISCRVCLFLKFIFNFRLTFIAFWESFIILGEQMKLQKQNLIIILLSVSEEVVCEIFISVFFSIFCPFFENKLVMLEKHSLIFIKTKYINLFLNSYIRFCGISRQTWTCPPQGQTEHSLLLTILKCVSYSLKCT